ncbi:hypothetical protein NTGBS_40016 [Candidatus Nitrotoga sp. BS]|nr:hypothetical protein NTGBS_40016 [Candidatus Nitrotoga sp. BS]
MVAATHDLRFASRRISPDRSCVRIALSVAPARDAFDMPSTHVQRMQKALTQMNIQLTNVISGVVGETGQKILCAIVAGERDGQVLAAIKNERIRATVDEIAKSLQGNWRGASVCAQASAGYVRFPRHTASRVRP